MGMKDPEERIDCAQVFQAHVQGNAEQAERAENQRGQPQAP
jgi:hypothetical protein